MQEAIIEGPVPIGIFSQAQATLDQEGQILRHLREKILFSKRIWNKVTFNRVFIKGNDKRLQIKRMLNYDSYRKPFTVSYLLPKLPWFECIYRLNSTVFFTCILIFTLTFPGPSWHLPCDWGGFAGFFFIQIWNLTAWLWKHYSFSLFGNRNSFLKSFLKIKKYICLLFTCARGANYYYYHSECIFH